MVYFRRGTRCLRWRRHRCLAESGKDNGEDAWSRRSHPDGTGASCGALGGPGCRSGVTVTTKPSGCASPPWEERRPAPAVRTVCPKVPAPILGPEGTLREALSGHPCAAIRARPCTARVSPDISGSGRVPASTASRGKPGAVASGFSISLAGIASPLRGILALHAGRACGPGGAAAASLARRRSEGQRQPATLSDAQPRGAA